MAQNVPGKEVALLQAGREIMPGYVLVKPLGQGGFGEVWQARAVGGFDVALKCVRLGAADGVPSVRLDSHRVRDVAMGELPDGKGDSIAKVNQNARGS